jgi:calcium-dependent protein kinase
VQLHGVYEDEQCVELVMTLCTGGDLWSRIRRGVYSEREAARIVADVLRAVAQVKQPLVDS